MELSAFWAALLRRWYLLIVALLLAGGATYAMVDRIGPTYEIHGKVLLFPPTTTVERGAGSITEGNPYLFLGGLNQARDILIGTLTSQQVRSEIENQAPEADYEMAPDIASSGPVVAVDVTAPSEAEAITALGVVLERVPRGLVELQEGLPIEKSATITARILTADTEPEVVRKGQVRGGIVAAAATMVVSLLLIGLFDGLAKGRRERRLATRRAETAGESPKKQAQKRGGGRLRGGGRAGKRAARAEDDEAGTSLSAPGGGSRGTTDSGDSLASAGR